MMDYKEKNKMEESFHDFTTLSVSGEEPILMIEHHDDAKDSEKQLTLYLRASRQRMQRFLWMAVSAIVVLLIALAVILTRDMSYPHPPVLPASATDEENIDILNQYDSIQGVPLITAFQDSVNGVQMNFYKIENLYTHLSFEAPNEHDSTVYLYTRCADYRADNHQILADCVVDGKLISTGNNRSGYFASVEANMVIGVSLTNDVRDFCDERDGNYFRQFALVSAGQMGDIRLKGKAYRRALASKSPRDYYLIESQAQESLYDFAEAIMDYGVTDAIYLTGGDDYSFWRDVHGDTFAIGNPLHRDQGSQDVPLLYLIFSTQQSIAKPIE